MSQPTKPVTARVAAYRARKAAAGLSEVRGIYAPPGMHDTIKTAVAEIIARTPAVQPQAKRQD